MQIMKARQTPVKQRDDLKNYLSEINFDGMFFKGQMILGGILIFAFLLYFIYLG